MWGAGSGSEFVLSALFLLSLVPGSLVLWFSVSALGCLNTFRGASGEICPHGLWPRLLRDLVGAQSCGKEGYSDSWTQSLE